MILVHNQYIYIYTLDKPVFNNTATTKRAKSFVNNPDIVQLKCIASSVPPPIIEWGTPNKIDNLNRKTPVLNLRNLKAEHFGMYICRASNPLGVVFHTIELERICKLCYSDLLTIILFF